MQKSLLAFLYVCILFTTLNAASSQKSDIVAWKLYILSNHNEILESGTLASNVVLTLHYDENKINGNAGCNNFFGSFQMTQEYFLFKGIGATRKMCDMQSMRVESLLFELFHDGKVAYISQGDELILERDLIKAVFKKIP